MHRMSNGLYSSFDVCSFSSVSISYCISTTEYLLHPVLRGGGGRAYEFSCNTARSQYFVILMQSQFYRMADSFCPTSWEFYRTTFDSKKKGLLRFYLLHFGSTQHAYNDYIPVQEGHIGNRPILVRHWRNLQ